MKIAIRCPKSCPLFFRCRRRQRATNCQGQSALRRRRKGRQFRHLSPSPRVPPEEEVCITATYLQSGCKKRHAMNVVHFFSSPPPSKQTCSPCCCWQKFEMQQLRLCEMWPYVENRRHLSRPYVIPCGHTFSVRKK